MRLLITADLHLVPVWRPTVLTALRYWAAAFRPDVVAVAGDIASARDAEVALAALRECFPAATIAICLGNHDFWLPAGTPRNLKMADVIEAYWAVPAATHGIRLLDRENCVLPGLCLVGAYGHYDLGFAVPELAYGGRHVTLTDYFAGTPPVATPLRWRDFDCMPADLDLFAVAEAEAAGLQRRLESAPQPVLVLTHTPPFAALLGLPTAGSGESIYAFFRAYLGSRRAGLVLQKYSDRLHAIFCGHTHRPCGPVDVGGFVGVNVGSDYGRPAAWLVDQTATGLELQKVGESTIARK